MKTNKMLRAAAALLILVLLTTGIVGSSFAKYTATGSASDTARVAKWGVTITTSGSLYSDAYAASGAANGNLPAAWNNAAGADSISAAALTKGDNIVAPGTKSNDKGLSFSISGKPEVAVTVETAVNGEDIYLEAGTYGVLVSTTVNSEGDLKKLIDANTGTNRGVYNGNFSKVDNDNGFAPGTYYVLTDKVTLTNNYFPVKYTLGGTTPTANQKAIDIAAELAQSVLPSAAPTNQTAYKTAFTAANTYPANTDLGTACPNFGGQTLSWEWLFGDAADTNAADTILGDLIAARDAAAPKHVVVAFDGSGNAAALTPSKGADDYTVKNGSKVVANLRTRVDITLTVTQVD